MDVKEAKKMCNGLKHQFNLGKEGITKTFIENIQNYIKAHEIVKIKVLIAENKDSVLYYSDELAKETNSQVIERKGFTFTLFRKKRK